VLKPIEMKNGILLLLALFFVLPSFAQIDLEYQKPSEEILDLVDAPLSPRMRIKSDGSKAVLLYRKAYKSIAELSNQEMRLAGLRINPKADIGSRQRYYYDLAILDMKTGATKKVQGLPAEAQITYFTWSPDQNHMAFVNNNQDQISLYILNIETAIAKKLSNKALHANMGRPFVWSPDSKSLLVKTIPSTRPPLIDPSSVIPSGPTISVNDGKKAQNRTYQDLLKDNNDEANFERLATSSIEKMNLDGTTSTWKSNAMHRSINFSPDGQYVLVSEVKRPFSYLVPYYRFPTTTNIFNKKGKLIKTVAEVPLAEDLPKGFMAVVNDKRGINWRKDAGSTLYWVEPLDGGNPDSTVTHRDAVYTLEAPFNGDAELLIKTKDRFYQIEWGTNDVAIAHDYWWNTRNTRTYLFNPSDRTLGIGRVIHDRNYQDRYSDPGEFATTKNKWNEEVLYVNDYKVYLMGDGYSDKGVFPFVDEYHLSKDKTKRLWEATDSTTLERLVFPLDMAKGEILTRIESKDQFPNYYFRNIKNGTLKPATNFPNPFKSIADVDKEVITYKRDDGVDLSGTLYLPPGYDKAKKEKLPMILWAYPVEFKDKSSAGQVTSSPNEFTYPWYGSPIFWVLKGYAVLDDASFPILGEGDEEPNDSFRKQLVGNAKAAIDAVDDMGYIDRDRVAVGGHSYGAFMTANLLSHSNLFAAGIARSGAYNRTLTPFGFQSEERNYWEAPEIYYTMSPFMHADKMKTPLLLIHGEEDNNSGTYPMQSERYFNALKGLGATVRLVMLPKESHGYSARESILHMLWEQDQWLDKHVKNKVKEVEK